MNIKELNETIAELLNESESKKLDVKQLSLLDDIDESYLITKKESTDKGTKVGSKYTDLRKYFFGGCCFILDNSVLDLNRVTPDDTASYLAEGGPIDKKFKQFKPKKDIDSKVIYSHNNSSILTEPNNPQLHKISKDKYVLLAEKHQEVIDKIGLTMKAGKYPQPENLLYLGDIGLYKDGELKGLVAPCSLSEDMVYLMLGEAGELDKEEAKKLSDDAHEREMQKIKSVLSEKD